MYLLVKNSSNHIREINSSSLKSIHFQHWIANEKNGGIITWCNDGGCNHFYPRSVEYTSSLPSKQRPCVFLKTFFSKHHKILSTLGLRGNNDIKWFWHGLANEWVQSVYDNWYGFVWFSFKMFFEESHNFESVSTSFCLSSCVELRMLSRDSKMMWDFAVNVEDSSVCLILKLYWFF